MRKAGSFFFFFFLSPVKLGERRRKSKGFAKADYTCRPPPPLRVCVRARACACPRRKGSVREFKSILPGRPSFTLLTPRIIGAGPSPHPRATPSPGPSSKGFTALTLAPPPPLQAARETTRAQPWRPRVTFRGQQSFIQSRFAPHPALFKQHFFDYVAVQILVFLICTFSLFTSLSVLNPYSPQTSPAGFLARDLAIYSNQSVLFFFLPPYFFSQLSRLTDVLHRVVVPRCGFTVSIAISPSWIRALNSLRTVSRQSD